MHIETWDASSLLGIVAAVSDCHHLFSVENGASCCYQQPRIVTWSRRCNNMWLFKLNLHIKTNAIDFSDNRVDFIPKHSWPNDARNTYEYNTWKAWRKGNLIRNAMTTDEANGQHNFYFFSVISHFIIPDAQLRVWIPASMWNVNVMTQDAA